MSNVYNIMLCTNRLCKISQINNTLGVFKETVDDYQRQQAQQVVRSIIGLLFWLHPTIAGISEDSIIACSA